MDICESTCTASIGLKQISEFEKKIAVDLYVRSPWTQQFTLI